MSRSVGTTHAISIRDHVAFFLALDPSHHGVEIPTCPEWTVEGVLRHVSGGALTVCEWVERADNPDLDPIAVLLESHSFSWGMHRHDVELALGWAPSLTAERAGDLIGWLLEYLQPTVGADRSWDRPPGLRLVADDAPLDVVAGEGESRAVLRASARDLLMFLWRRPTGHVSIEGDPRILHAYLDRVV